jgi:Uma2 family endonuclease
MTIPYDNTVTWKLTMNPNLLDPDQLLPGSADLPCSDDTPVDNENQNLLPNWLLAVLEQIWGDREDWFFGVDMGIYDRAAQASGFPVVVPDGFLSLGVSRHKRGDLGRLSYVLQEENNIAPLFALEIVSKTYGEEYSHKLNQYARLGVKYYLIYNREYGKRDQHLPFEVYKLEGQRYQLQTGEPYWMPELGLGIGRRRGKLGRIEREWLAWYDRLEHPYPLPIQIIEQERQRSTELAQALQQEQQRANQERLERLRLMEKLRQLGIDPEQL